MSDLFRLTDQTALVTGASSGIGAATAEVLAERGARVALGYHRNKKGAEENLKKPERSIVDKILDPADLWDF